MIRFSMRRSALSRLGYCAAMALLAITTGASVSRAFEIKRAGKLKVGRDVPLMAFSTDPTFQQVLSDDFAAARRAPGSSIRSVSTVTVTVSQQPLKPGISLNDLAPGDPQVADLIKAAGANPPPVGDTGMEFDEAAFARQQQARNWMPSDTPMEQMIQQFGPSGGGDPEMGMMGMGMMGPPLPCASRSVVTPGCPPPVQETPNAQPSSPGYTGDTQEYMRQGAGGPLAHFFGHDGGDRGYDVVIVARAAVSGQNEEMTVVSVVHPGEDPHDAKKLMAEKIADSILH